MCRHFFPDTCPEMVRRFNKKNFTPSNCFAFFAALCGFSLLYSPFLLSISMWGFCVVSLWHRYNCVKAPLPFWQRLKTAFLDMFKRLWAQPAFMAFTLLFFMVLLSGFWSENLHYWGDRFRVRIPFFVLPWAFANAPILSQKQWETPLKTLVWVLFVTCLGIGINFWIHSEAILLAIEQGRSIPVPRNHIRFSLTLAFGSVLAWYFFKNAPQNITRWCFGLLAVFFFAFAHFLAVRSGLLALYLAVVFLLLRYIFLEKKWATGLLLLFALPLVLWAARTTVPSLSNKVDYMLWEFQEYRAGRAVGDSDAGRWASFRVGMVLFQEHPLLGVGAGDLEDATKTKTAVLYAKRARNFRLPHNQYIYLLASTGLLGFLASMYAFFAFFKEKRYRNSVLCLVFALIAHSSFLSEHTIETAIGVAFYLFFTLYLMMNPALLVFSKKPTAKF